MFQNIDFQSQGATLRGHLYYPKKNIEMCPVVIMAHGFTSTIMGMTADKYADRFRQSGYVVLLYDHRNFGASDGEPRQEINYWVQTRGYIDAIDYIYSLPKFAKSKIAIWGASLSASEVFLVGSVDDRVAAIITIIPAFGDCFSANENHDNTYGLVNEILRRETILDLPHFKTERMAVVSPDQNNIPSQLKDLTAFNWFMEYGGRFGTNWQNTVSFSKLEKPNNFHVGKVASHLKASILMIVAKNDEMAGASPEVARKIFKLIRQPKEWVDISGGHFGLLYYPSTLFEKSSKAQINFLERQFIDQ